MSADKKPKNLDVKGMRPVGDHVLVTPIPEDDELVHGTLRLVLADTAKDKPNRGVVVSVGEGRILPDGTIRPIGLKAGDRLLFSKYAGNEFDRGGETYLVISYDDILVVLE